MHRNHIWLAFLATVSLVVLWFTIATGYKIYEYTSYSNLAPVSDIDWSVIKRSEDRYLLKGRYIYSVEGQSYKGEDTLPSPVFRNSWAAKEAMPEMTEKIKEVWVSPKDASHSIINRTIPIKETIYSVILWILLIYFIWLGYYVNRRRRKWS